MLGTAVPQANGTVIYTANAGASGLDQFLYRVADTDGCQSAETLVRVEICGPPTAVRDNLCLCPGSSTLLDVLANDLPGTCGPTDPSTLYLSSLPPPSSGVSVAVEAGRPGTCWSGFLYLPCGLSSLWSTLRHGNGRVRAGAGLANRAG